MTESLLARSWARAWSGAGARGDGRALRDALLAAYREPQRAYHTLQHLTEGVALLDGVRALAAHPAEVTLAWWFHDAVVDLGRDDNEARSATWARQALVEAGVASDVAQRVHDAVLCTRHDAPPAPGDAQLLVDIDLAILGAAPARFDEYEDQVRREHAAVPDDAFRRGRRAVLEGFAARPALYGTPALRERFEAAARLNLQRALARWAEPVPAPLWLVFADSELGGVEVDGATLRLRLSAASVVRLDGSARGAGTPGYSRGVEIELRGVAPARLPAGAPGRIAQGRVTDAQGRSHPGLPLPGTLTGPLTLELDLAHRTTVALAADSLHCAFRGEPQFAESLFC